MSAATCTPRIGGLRVAHETFWHGSWMTSAPNDQAKPDAERSAPTGACADLNYVVIPVN
jgi:hypothetical protein